MNKNVFYTLSTEFVFISQILHSLTLFIIQRKLIIY